MIIINPYAFAAPVQTIYFSSASTMQMLGAVADNGFVNIDIPAVSAGDVTFLVITSGADLRIVTGDSTWSIVVDNNNVQLTSKIYWKRHSSNASATSVEFQVSTEITSTVNATATVYTFKGCRSSGTPYLDGYNYPPASSTTLTISSRSVTNTPSSAVVFYNEEDDTAVTLTSGTDWVKSNEQSTVTGTDYRNILLTSYFPTNGSSDAITFTTATSEYRCAYYLFLYT